MLAKWPVDLLLTMITNDSTEVFRPTVGTILGFKE